MAARSLNQVLLIGNLTRDPELRYTPQGTAVCQFGLATNRDWVTASGEKKEEVQYHRIIAWSKLAELCSQLLVKGTKVFVEGRIVYRSFEGKDGTQKQVTEIVMDNMIVLSAGSKMGRTMEEGSEEKAKGRSETAEEHLEEVPPEDDTATKTPVTADKDVPADESVSEDEIPF